MPTKTKHMARKASLSESAPLSKQLKTESEKKVDMSMSVVLDTAKVTAAAKNLAKIPKKPVKIKEEPAPIALKVKSLSNISSVKRRFRRLH